MRETLVNMIISPAAVEHLSKTPHMTILAKAGLAVRSGLMNRRCRGTTLKHGSLTNN